MQRPRRSLFGFLAYWLTVTAIWGLIAVMGLVVWYAYDLPDVSDLDAYKRRPSISVLAADGSEFARVGDLYGEPVTVASVPPHLPRAVVAIEDRRFYSHFGLDPIGLMRAVWVNLRAGRIVQGGSTISQQLAKNLFLTSDRTLKRKVQEVLLALWLEANFSKDEILSLYLNRVYLGAGAYGVDAAARRYFGKSANEVNMAEAAMLAGLLKAPSRFAPTRDLAAARNRAAVVLASMVDAGLATAQDIAQARQRPAGLHRPKDSGIRARYFADWLLDRLPDYIGSTDRDLVIVTTLDPRLQQLAEVAVVRSLDGPGQAQQVGQAALVALDHNGAVKAMVGGRNYQDSQFNRVTQALRQPGSAFKPVVYLAGMEAGLQPNSVFVDQPVTVDGWSPRNYTDGHVGQVRLAEALSRSINTVAVQVSEYAGRHAVADAALRLGISTPVPRRPSIALGTAEVTPIDLATVYVAFANGARGVLPYGIVEIRDNTGNVLYRRSGGGAGRVMDPRLAQQMTAMLTETIEQGTGRAARLDRPAAGKTGTSQDYRDAWFVGYTADLVAAVWVGNDDGRAMKGVTGSGIPARLWRDFMLPAHKGQPIRPVIPDIAPPSDENFLDRIMRVLSSRSGSVPQPTAGDGRSSDSYEEKASP